ncbi:TetR/AcrR family transcriptional regulator [Streptomyces sp. SID10815]|uniref:TetR/AcrR family transcriptional regulator n=1 Tax=Streptomyces sp. SID10815 TaxID=2706027 RepID=UPI0013CA1ABA|nr:TetR/AcrR family transcriptional regulator [Streptomyces sp. SID10815]NEA51613.1 TetR family transcriptional regulator [Streptomyces sp. SID10815]
MTELPLSRRERKKAQTRQAIADAALDLFLDRGYDHVSIRDIADAADVSTATIFKHFPGKEALVFDQEEDVDAQLIAAVRRRVDGQSILDALRQHLIDTWLPLAAHPQRQDFDELVQSTPALRAYAERMWARHTDTLSAAIADELGVPHDDLACRTLARFVLNTPVLSQGQEDRRAAIDEVFGILTHGWQPPSRP